MFKHLVMIDTEFTSLDPNKAFIREVGAVLVSFPFDTTKSMDRHVLGTYSNSWPVPAKEWDPQTLEWAKVVYSGADFEKMTRHSSYSTMQKGLDEFFHQLGIMIDGTSGKDNVLVMFNHPEADVPKLMNALPAKAPTSTPWHYRNVQDLQSVIWGLCQYNEDMFKELATQSRESYGPVTHKAVDDCKSQLNWLYTVVKALENPNG